MFETQFSYPIEMSFKIVQIQFSQPIESSLVLLAKSDLKLFLILIKVFVHNWKLFQIYGTIYTGQSLIKISYSYSISLLLGLGW